MKSFAPLQQSYGPERQNAWIYIAPFGKLIVAVETCEIAGLSEWQARRDSSQLPRSATKRIETLCWS